MVFGGEGFGYVDEVMEIGNGVFDEEVFLDENKEVREYEFYYVGEVKVNCWVVLLLLDLLFIIFIFFCCFWGYLISKVLLIIVC